MEVFFPDKSSYLTSRWAGGTTTQMAICPAGADYGARDFLWRLSSAQVAQEYSVFTSLSDYERFLGIVEGTLFLQTDDEGFFPLPVGQVWQFDGGKRVISQGTCRDFNLMLRKGVCTGAVFGLRLCGAQRLSFPEPCARHTLRGVFCADGSLNLAGQTLRAGEIAFFPDGTQPELSGNALVYAFQIESDDAAILNF